jgi:hypothetical protein
MALSRPLGVGRGGHSTKGFVLMTSTFVITLLAQRYQLHFVPGHRVETEAMDALRRRHGI